MIRRPPRSTHCISSAASDVYKRQEVGAGNQPESWIAELLAAKDRTLAAATAKAEGLYLVSVDYPAHYDLPVMPMGPLFLAD